MNHSPWGDGVLKYQGRLCVPDLDRLRVLILDETLRSRYSIYPGSKKMYHDLREINKCVGLKSDIEIFVDKCPNCQQVKAEHLKSGGLLKRSKFKLRSGKTSIWTL